MIAQILSVRNTRINDLDVQTAIVKERDWAIKGGGEGFLGVSGSLLTPTWPFLFSVKSDINQA